MSLSDFLQNRSLHEKQEKMEKHKKNGKYFVYEENTLGFMRPDEIPNYFTPLAGSCDWRNGGFRLLDSEKAALRLATEADFAKYRVSLPPDFLTVNNPEFTQSGLDARFGTDAAIGVIYDKSAHHGEGGSVFRDGMDAICCTHYALQVQKALPEHAVRVVGFCVADNPDCAVSREGWHEGHDFALVDQRWLVDPWARLVEGVRKQIVYDLKDPEDRRLAKETYGSPQNWVEVYGTDGSLSRFNQEWDRSGLESMCDPVPVCIPRISF